MPLLRPILVDAIKLYWVLIKIMIPVMIAVKLAVSLGVIRHLSALLAPLMGLVGLPAEMGVVWATACLVNIYAGAAALLGILPQVPLTVAQVTILGSMILAAHSLPIEQRVCQRAGAGLVFTTLLRLAAALAYGAILNWTYASLDLLQQPMTTPWLPVSSAESGWGEWALASLESLVTIFVIILALVALLRVLEATGITALLSRLLAPVLRLMGISPDATALTMAGVLLGLGYGGALIIKEAQSGKLSRRDILLAVSFMAICHSLIEDTLFVMAMGAHWSGVLLGRVVFSLVVMVALARLVQALPDHVTERWLMQRATTKA